MLAVIDATLLCSLRYAAATPCRLRHADAAELPLLLRWLLGALRQLHIGAMLLICRLSATPCFLRFR